jgi:proliferating cell nuclear antigen
MFEAKLTEGHTLKKIVEAIKDLVTDVNLDVSPQGISLQAMDTSHVALVSLFLSMEGFE